MKLGFVGLGTMGGPMAGHLLKGGAELAVWNRTPAKSEAIGRAGATVAKTLQELGASCDAVMLCVNRTEDLEECVAGLRPSLRRGSLVVDHSTISAAAAARLHRDLAGDGIAFVDAPVTGGSMGAQKGQLTIFLGGDQLDCARAAEIVKPYAKRAERVGGPGAGQTAKLANQIAVAGALLGLCECMAFASKADLDLAQIKELVGSGAAGSWAFDNYGPKILARDWSPGFSIKNQRKDFAYCREAASSIGAQIPGTLLVDEILSRLESNGRGEQATAALYEELLAGVDLGRHSRLSMREGPFG